MKTILVPTDGSKVAEKALDVALDLAQQHGAHVTLFHVLLRDKEPDELLRLPDLEAIGKDVVDTLRKIDQAPEPAHTAEELMNHSNSALRPVGEDLLRRIGVHILSRAKGQAAARGVEVKTLELADASPAQAIIEAAKTANADTIVMGMRGLRYIEATAFGSVSHDVCRNATCTCVAVH